MRDPIRGRLCTFAVFFALAAAPAAVAGLPFGSVVPDRLFVVVSPGQDVGGSAVIAFDVDAQGRPEQRESYETGGLGRALTSPQEVLVDRAGRFLFVCNNESDEVSVFSILADRTLAPVQGSPFAVGRAPSWLALAPDRRVVYTSNPGDDTIGVYGIGEDGSLSERQSVPSRLVRDLEIAPGGDFLYAVDMWSGVRAYRIAKSGTLEELPGSPFGYPSLSRPWVLRIPDDGSRLFVLDLDSGLVVYDVDPFGGLDLLGGPWALAGYADLLLAKDGRLYVGHYSEATIEGFGIGPGGMPVALAGSPFAAEGAGIALLGPMRLQRLYQVTGWEALSAIVPFAIRRTGALSPLGDPVAVIDPDGRSPNGAAYFRALRPSAVSRGDGTARRRYDVPARSRP